MVEVIKTCTPGCTHHYHAPTSHVMIVNDQSTIKGALWGFAAFKFGSATLGCVAATLATSPLIVTPLIPIPLGFGLSSYLLGSMTSSCLDNACYHLGSRSVKVITVS